MKKTIKEVAYEIEHLKLLQVLDWTQVSYSWYEAEIHMLGLELKELLSK
jgi:hypothetical protein